MLGKLLKYDLKNIFKFLSIFYCLSIFFAILTRIFLNVESSFVLNIIGKICSGTTIAMIFNALINNLMRLWVRFKQNLYGDESYLTHTLPVTKKEIYLSKVIASLISLFTSMLVIGITLFIAYYSEENIEFVRNLLTQITDIYSVSIVGLISILIFVLFLEGLNILQIGFTGIIIGHKMDSNKNLLSILSGFGVYSASQMVILVICFLMSIFNDGMLNLFITNGTINFDMFKVLIHMSIALYMLMICAIYFINTKLFNEGVNVE